MNYKETIIFLNNQAIDKLKHSKILAKLDCLHFKCTCSRMTNGVVLKLRLLLVCTIRIR